MDLLYYLTSHDASDSPPKYECEVEYRLLCSGTLYRDRVLGDWTKSDTCRLIVHEPFQTMVCSHRIDENPQELSVRFRIQSTEVGDARDRLIYFADSQIIDDLAAFLTVYTRRPISILGKIRSLYLDDYPSHLPLDSPRPIHNLSARHWTPRGFTIRSAMNSVEIQSNDPPPVAVDPERVIAQLRALAQSNSQDVFRAIRLYATALDLLMERPQVAYVLLVSTIETLADGYMKKWLPTEDERVEPYRGLMKQGRRLGLTEEQARSLALSAGKQNPWIKRRFIEFVIDRVDEGLWSDDDLFPTIRLWQAEPAKLRKYLGQVYDSRSKVVHEGRTYPLGFTVGTSNLIDDRVLYDLMTGGLDGIPPIAWFERVVSICLRSRVEEIATSAR